MCIQWYEEQILRFVSDADNGCFKIWYTLSKDKRKKLKKKTKRLSQKKKKQLE